MSDIIIDRFEEGKCPLCDEEITEDFKREEYKGKKIWIHTKHPSPKKQQ
jgi:hypothetical protein